MGEKTSARRVASSAGVPVVPGNLEPLSDLQELRVEAERVGFPVMLKAAAGGGGKGLRLVRCREDLAASAERAAGEAQSAFGDGRLYVEKVVPEAHHVEVQVLADHHGNVVHLFERECSVQRRHQKLLEESPSPFLTEDLRLRMGGLAVTLARRAGYRNAGTLEFLVDADRRPYFLEMNTRLQVEHPVTEMLTGLDLVKLQIRIAEGEALPFDQSQVPRRGHAIECRIYAEDASNGFLPSPGRISLLRCPGGPGVRDDSGVYEGWEVPVHYDSLLSKLVVHGESRSEAILRMRRALGEYEILGVATTLPFLVQVLSDEDFVRGAYDTSLVDRIRGRGIPDSSGRAVTVAVVAAAIHAFRERRRLRPPALADGQAASPWWRAGLAEAQRGRS